MESHSDGFRGARRCPVCGRALYSPMRCPKCGRFFCKQHLPPNSHGCPSRSEKTRHRSRRPVIVAAALMAVIVGGLIVHLMLSQVSPGLSPAVTWIKTERIRAGYCDPGNSSDLLQKLRESGMNTVITYSSLERAESVARIYKEAGLHLFISIPFLIGGTDYRPSVKKDGQEKVAPCPLDAGYWNNAVMGRLMSIAEASRTYPIDGVLIDTEMAVSKGASYYGPALCFCDDCFERYARITKKGAEVSQVNIPRIERYEWLESRGYLDEYYDVLEKRVENMVRKFEKRVHDINPNLILGFLLYEDNWYYRALSRGLSTPSMPVLILDETTYVRGYTYLVDEIVGYFGRRRVNVMYLPGLWLLHHSPENLTAQIYYLAANTSGYWIFPLGSLWTENLTGDSRLAGPRDAYWDSLRMADSELDKYLGGGYHSSLECPVREICPYQFRVLQHQDRVVIKNIGFADRHNVKVVINGDLVTTISVIGCKGSSDPIAYTKRYVNTSSYYSNIGLCTVAVMDSSGLYDLLGKTDPSAFSRPRG